MGFRRKKSEVLGKKRWHDFLIENHRLIEQIGLPETVVGTEERFDDFLMHGYIDHHDDPSKFTIEHLDDDKYRKCFELIERCIEAGFVKRTELSSINFYLRRSSRPC